jgi:Ca2+-transporting ATPase
MCREAGILPKMITGDHPLTARYIASELGILDKGQVLTGQDLDTLSPDNLAAIVEDISVFARVSPEHKLQIVQALQSKGHITAMTGDGVNDAPALKKADIGISMGITGTDVAKEASDMVLLDDNFTTIVAAVEEGRMIYDNIRRFIKYLTACNSGEVWVMLIGPLMGMPLPLLPLQILWMNLVTDGLPALALGVEPPERNIMKRRPYPPNENIFSRGLGIDVIWIGLLMSLLALAVGYNNWLNNPSGVWQTMLFTTLTFAQMALALSVRSENDTIIDKGLLTNKPLLGAVALTIVLQLIVVYLPPLQTLFGTMPLSGVQLLICIAISSIVFVGVELKKVLFRNRL